MTGPQVRRKVHDACSDSARTSNPLGGRAVRQRAEHEFGLLTWCIVGRHERHVARRERKLLATSLIGRGEAEFELRVAGDECAQLAAGVAAGAKDADGNSMHD